DQEEIDGRSIYVGNVDYKSTHDQILAYFQSCGTVNRITILSDKTTGHPKGCCYVEFLNKESINNAMALNDSIFNDRQIKITPKRTNLPYYMRNPGGTRQFRGARGGIRGGAAGKKKNYLFIYLLINSVWSFIFFFVFVCVCIYVF
ncbi:hypothetical protein DICPUDRAFT_24800, partial [Dictyostelium purpureum]